MAKPISEQVLVADLVLFKAEREKCLALRAEVQRLKRYEYIVDRLLSVQATAFEYALEEFDSTAVVQDCYNVWPVQLEKQECDLCHSKIGRPLQFRRTLDVWPFEIQINRPGASAEANGRLICRRCWDREPDNDVLLRRLWPAVDEGAPRPASDEELADASVTLFQLEPRE